MGGAPVAIPIRQENDFRMDPDELASLVTARTRLIVINSPANPTGGVLTREDLERIAEIALRHDLAVLSDEIYARILYDGGEHTSIAALPGMAERTIVLDGFSKTYAMTGWRLGYGIVPADLGTGLRPPADQLRLGRHDLRPARAPWRRSPGRRTTWTRWSPSSARGVTSWSTGSTRSRAFRCLRPAGAFYAFPEVSGTGLTGAELAERLLQEAGVSVLAGTAFGTAGHEPHPALVRQLAREPHRGAAADPHRRRAARRGRGGRPMTAVSLRGRPAVRRRRGRLRALGDRP